MAVDDPVGIITRIALKNFVTYDDVVVKPGKNLNLIIGANGTGKSTIVSAIVLGLGGSPKVIGRAPTLSDYVKAGQTSASIQIDLQAGPNQVVTITRNFNNQNQTTWLINNSLSNRKKVIDLMSKFNIQVDNLCQFLPQDRVQEFSNLTAQQLLLETERSVGDPKLSEFHTQLIDLREKQATLEKDLGTHTRLLTKEKQTCDLLKDKVGHIQEQRTIQKKLKTLKQKKAWIIYQEKRDDFKRAKIERDEAEKTKKKIEKKMKPIESEITKLKTSIQNLEKTAKQYNAETSSKLAHLNRLQQDIENKERSIDDAERDCQNQIKEEQQKDERMAVVNETINKFENDLEHKINEVGSVESLNDQLESISQNLNQHKKNLGELQAQFNFFHEKKEHCSRKIRVEEQNLQEVHNIEAKRLDLLYKLNKDAYNGVSWLRSNKHLFSKPIYEPILLLINLKDAKYSKFFENVLPFRDLTAFVCEDKNDMNLLIRYLRDQQKLKINVVHSDPDREVNDQPNRSLQSIRQLGFEHYLLSLIDAPRTILNYLINQYHLHQIPIGNDNVEQNLKHIPEDLTFFFSSNKSFHINRSKYSGEKSTRQSVIASKNLLSITVDSDKINQIKNRLAELDQERSSYDHKIQSVKEKISKEEEKSNTYKEIRRKLEADIGKIRELQSKIALNKKRIEHWLQEQKSVDEIRAEYKAKIQKLILEQLQIYQNYIQKLDDYYKSAIVNEEMKLQVKLKKNQLAEKERDSHEIREECENAERNFRNLENEIRPLRQEVEKLYVEAKNMTNGISFGDEDFEPFERQFAKLPATLEEIINEIQKTQAKAFSVDDRNEAQQVLNNYNAAKKHVEKLSNDISNEEEELIKVTEEIAKVKEEWLPMLNVLVEKINKNFSDCFRKMKCAGEVSLTDGGNAMDFAKYGLKIRVKFRDADDLQVLSRNHQSGGERTVTTAAYMISLQELTRVPFRCVDEINQGMDAANERRVFELIVNITSMTNSAQYFLLTPKLLPDLKYHDSMTVLTVFNGKYMAPCSEFDIRDNIDSICNVIKNRRLAAQ